MKKFVKAVSRYRYRQPFAVSVKHKLYKAYETVEVDHGDMMVRVKFTLVRGKLYAAGYNKQKHVNIWEEATEICRRMLNIKTKDYEILNPVR